MIHSIISWDCSYRNFFYLIDGLLDQDYNRDEFELIYVEQRTEEVANNYNHKLGLKSLRDRYEEVKDQMNIQVVYLEHDDEVPYHLGKCNNKGIEIANGEIISVMDGDLLLSSNFLTMLEEYHNQKAVINLFRYMASSPVGVEEEKWTQGVISFKDCLELCPNRNDSIPNTTSNKGPLISARKEYWEAVNGYDLHSIWSTGLSRLGQDVNARLEIAIGMQSFALPDAFAVHPYHPAGFRRNEFKSQKLLDLQQQLINWAVRNKEPSWKARTSYTKKLYNINRIFVDEMVYSDFPSLPCTSEVKIATSMLKKVNTIYGKVIKKIFQIKQSLRCR